MDAKKCVGCEVEKPVSEFGSNGRGYYKSRCKPCYNFQQAERREDPEVRKRLRNNWNEASKKYYSTERRRNKTLEAYGLTKDDYNTMYDEQGGVCAICRQDLKLVVDHCHETGVVRGLLCNQCNIGLGAFCDNIDRMKTAMLYLKPHS